MHVFRMHSVHCNSTVVGEQVLDCASIIEMSRLSISFWGPRGEVDSQFKKCQIELSVLAHTFNPALVRQRQERSLSSRPPWSSVCSGTARAKQRKPILKTKAKRKPANSSKQKYQFYILSSAT